MPPPQAEQATKAEQAEQAAKQATKAKNTTTAGHRHRGGGLFVYGLFAFA